ncbi:MAG: carboxypeptidase-like regulatory domain-containing protein [Thermoanaerobaculaceae bacterium]
MVDGGRADEPLPGVQVSARSERTGALAFVLSGEDGGFSLGGLAPGDYEVRTCFDGFDTLIFHMTLDPTASADGLKLTLRASEAGGRTDVAVTRSR